jgi:hypothetical protein
MSRKTHTMNPVPTLVFGPDAAALAEQLPRLEDFAEALLNRMDGEGE